MAEMIKMEDKKSREKKEIIDSINCSIKEKEELDKLLNSLEFFLDDLGALFKHISEAGLYHREISPDDLKALYDRAKKIYFEFKSLEMIEISETKHLVCLLNDARKGEYGEIIKKTAEELEMQKKINDETKTVESFFEESLDYFKKVIITPEKLDEAHQGRQYLMDFFVSARNTVIDEISQNDFETQKLEEELKEFD